MKPKALLAICIGAVALSFIGLKIFRHQNANAVAAKVSVVVSESSDNTLAIKYEDVSSTGLTGLIAAQFKNFELRNLLTQTPLLRFSKLTLQVDLSSYFSPELKIKLEATGPSGDLKVTLEIDKRALEKGFVLQKRALYQAKNLDLGPLLDALLAFHLQNSIKRQGLSSTVKGSTKSRTLQGPPQTVHVKNFEVTGSVRYSAITKSIYEFGSVDLDLNVQRMALGIQNQPGLDHSFVGKRLKMTTNKQGAIKATAPLRLSARSAELILDPQFEVRPGEPQLWSAFLKIDFQPKTTAARELLQRLRYEWQCGRSTEPKSSGRQRLLAAFQYNRLLCFERRK